jgi:hypothetical protein
MQNTVAGVYQPGGTFAPSEIMTNNFTNEQLASAWLQDAEISEGIAQRLRKQAYVYCPEWKSSKRIESMPTKNLTGEAFADFVCCKVEFSDVESLVKHVQGVHTQPQLVIVPEPRSKAMTIKPESAIPTEEEPVRLTSPLTTAWTPFAVSQMPSNSFLVPASTITFPAEMLHAHFHGDQWSPGFWFVKSDSILPSKSYWLLNHNVEPFLPSAPGQHGAKLTPFFNDTLSGNGDAPGEEHYQRVPLFIESTDANDPGFRYFGEYSQTRYSDQVGYDTLMANVPNSVRRYWAKQLSEHDRPPWVTQKLVEQFWPKPVYEGPITSSTETETTSRDGRVSRALEKYGEELAEWKRESEMRVSLLTEQNIYEAFAEPDSGLEPGLRLSWEYMECVNWDDRFYEMLVQLKDRHENGYVDAAGRKINKNPVMIKDTFKQTKPKVVKETSRKTSDYPLTHADGSAAFTWVNGRRITMPQQTNGAKPSTKTEKTKQPNGPENSPTTNGNPQTKEQGGKKVNPFKGDLEAAKQFSRDLIPPHMRGRR